VTGSLRTRMRTWAPTLGAAATLAVVLWRLGDGPFLDGLRALDGRLLAAAAAIGLVTTVCCAWRWRIVARGVGVDLPLPAAVAAYYRSLFLNLTLPGGVVGDVHRGLAHGRDTRDVGRALRAVVWERTGGQLVQLLMTLGVLVVLPSPVHGYMPVVAVALVASLGCSLLAGRRAWQGARRSPLARARRTLAADLTGILRVRGAVPAIALTSLFVVLGHAATFLLAARAAGSTAPPSRLLPLALLAMLAMVLPSVAGWGPREGAAGWVFGAAGLGAGLGVETAVVYGVMALVAALPGALLLVATSVPRSRILVRSEGASNA
jgi:glycosyltransferase 2 family protein